MDNYFQKLAMVFIHIAIVVVPMCCMQWLGVDPFYGLVLGVFVNLVLHFVLKLRDA